MLLLSDAAIFMMLIFTCAIWKFYSLNQGMVKLFSKVTVSSVNNIEKERVGKNDTAMVPLLPLLFGVSVLMLIMFAAAVQEWVLNFIVPIIENVQKKICTMVYIHKIPLYHIRSKIKVLVTIHTYFWTNCNHLFHRLCLSVLGSILCGTCHESLSLIWKQYQTNIMIMPRKIWKQQHNYLTRMTTLKIINAITAMNIQK